MTPTPHVRASGQEGFAECLMLALARQGCHLDPTHAAEITDSSGDPDLDRLTALGERHGLFVRPVLVGSQELEDISSGAIVELQPGRRWAIFDELSRRGLLFTCPGERRRVRYRPRINRPHRAFLLYPLGDFVRAMGRRPSIARYLWTLLSRFRSRAGQILLLSALIQGLAIATPLLTRTIVDSVIPHNDGRLLLIIAISLIPSGALFALAWYIRARMLISLRSVFDVSASLDFVHHLLSLRFTDLQRWTTGDLAARFDSHNQVRDSFARHLLFATSDGLLVIGYVVSLLLINLPLGIACALMTLLQVGVLLLSAAQRSSLWEEKMSAQKECTSFEYDMIAGVETIKGMSLIPAVITRWSGMFVRQMNAMVLRWNRDVVVESILVTARISFPVVVLSVGAWEAMSNSRPIGEVIAHAAICNWFMVPLANLASATMMLHMLHPHVARVSELLSTSGEARARSSSRAPSWTPLRLCGAVEARNVHVELGGRAVLSGVDFRAAPGEFVAIVGRSGSGKTTLVRVLLGLISPSRGSLTYDEHDLEALGPSVVGRQVGVVNQNLCLFTGSVWENITLGHPDASAADVVEAASSAGIHDDIQALPQGYDTIIGDAGRSFLSGGQVQRLAIARALVRRPRVLFMDEATSALDAVTEQTLHEQLRKLKCTRISVAHRLSSVRQADRIFVLSRGVVVEVGTHPELLARGGEYARLVGA